MTVEEKLWFYQQVTSMVVRSGAPCMFYVHVETLRGRVEGAGSSIDKALRDARKKVAP